MTSLKNCGIELKQLNSFKLLLDKGDISGFYTLMLNNGYAYAGWARGVADGDSIAGLAALDFLNDSAMLGAIGSEVESPNPSVIQNIKQGMADSYLATLKAIATDSDCAVSRDINAEEVWKFHKEVFDKNGLSIENWTLHVPFTIYKDVYGEQALDDFWITIRDTAGEGPDAIWENSFVLGLMEVFSLDPFNSETEMMAEHWTGLVNADGIFSSTFNGFLAEVAEFFGESKDVILLRNLVRILLNDVVSSLNAEDQKAQITQIIDSIDTEEAARQYIDGIREFVYGLGNTATAEGDINGLVSNVASVVKEHSLKRYFTIESLASMTSGQLKLAAEDKIAYRYALLTDVTHY